MRKERNMTQIEVSSRMSRDQQSLQRVESGRVNPSLSYLIDLSEALEVEISELVSFKRID
jgi:transcriptional regulator with XRE-family HTH domain